MKFPSENLLSIDDVEPVLDFIGKQIERFSVHRLYVNLACAFAAALCASLLFYVVSTASDPFDPYRFFKYSLIAFSSYTAVALFLHRFWTGPLNRILPLWILIVVVGSLLNEIVGSIEWLPRAMSNPQFRAIYPTFNDFIWDEIGMIRSVFLAHSLIALPVTGIIYYAGTIVRALRAWHNRPEHLSILGK